MRNTKRVISMVLVVCMLLSVLPLSAFAVDISTKPANGTTALQPFLAGTGGSNNFRIPGIVTLADGTLIAASDARWNGTADAGGLDTIVSVSKDNGANWTYTFANYLGDNGNTWINTSSCIIDPAIGTDGETAYLIADLFPAGFAINSAKYAAQSGSTGFNAEGNLILRSDEENGITFGSSTYATDAAAAVHNYYLADGKIYSSEGSPVDGYTVDAYFNITGNGVNTNLFFADSPYKPFPTDYLYLTTSENGLDWSEPKLLNLKEASEQTLLIGPGNGTYDATTGRMVFTAYDYTFGYQRACVIWRETDGTWHRTEDASVDNWSSEASVVALDDGTLRCFYRDGYSVVRYTDFVWDSETANYVRDENATEVSTEAPRRSNNQLSAIRYTEQINGKDAILVACASSADARSNGYLYVFLLNDDNSMDLAYAYDIVPDTIEGYAYNCISVMANGDIALLYEGDNPATSANAEIIFTTIDMDDVTVFENDARLNFIDVELYVGDTVTYKDTTGNYDQVSEYDTAVAAVTANGTTATVPAATGMQSGTAYALEDALYTLTAVTGGWYLHHTLSDGTEVYIDGHAGAGNGGYPNRAYETVLTIVAGTAAGTMWVKDSGGSLHLHKEASAPYWNQCSNPCGYKHDLLFFRPAESGEAESDIFAGFVQVTNVADLEDGGKYLVAAYDDAENLYILNPVMGGLSATSNDQLAKVTGDAEISSTTVTIAGLAEGTTQAQIGDNVYNITVSERPAVEMTVKEEESVSFTIEGAYAASDVAGLDTSVATVTLVTEGDSVTYGELRDATNSGTQVALADSEYTFTDVGDGTWYATIAADSKTFYVRPNSKGHSETQTALTLTFNGNGSVYLNDSSHYLYVNRSSLAWDRTSTPSGYETHVTFYLYGAGEDASSAIPGYTMITSADDITDGEGYLIAFYGGDNQLYVMNPTTRTASAYNQMAAVVTGLENATTTVTVTGVAEGNTSMTLAGTQYNITVQAANYDPIAIPEAEYVYQGPAITMGQKPANGETEGQPFAPGTGTSGQFRIPGIVTMADGTLVASTDARWNHAGDGAGLDTLVSVSGDKGDNWTYTFANYLGDNGNTYNNLSTSIIDPAVGTDGETVYMIADLFPAGIALNTSKYGPIAGENGFDANGNLMLRDLAGDTVVMGQSGYNTMAGSRAYNYYLDLETYKIHTINGTHCAAFTVDEYFNISYTDAAGTTHSTNLFFADSPFQPYPTDYLYLTTSTDGLDWTAPKLLNLQAEAEQTLLVGPGNGTYDAVRGHMVFTAYRHTGGASGTAYECASLIWMDTEGNWHRSEDATTAGWSSEASSVVLEDGTVRMFYRDGYSVLRYTDYEWSDSANNYVRVATEVATAAPKKSGCQLTAIKYSEKIEGKEAVIVATPAYSGGRNDGHIYVFVCNEDGSMTLAYDYDVTPNSNEYYAYSCITEIDKDTLGLLWESNGSQLTFTKISMADVVSRDNDARLTFKDVSVFTGESVTVTDGTGSYADADTSELNPDVATVDVTASSVITMSAQLGSDASYSGALIDLASCLYTFTKNDNGNWVINNGDIYLNTNGNTGYPHGTTSCTFTIEAGNEDGTFYIRSTSDSNSQGNANYLYFDRAARNWNRVNNLQNNATWMANCSMSLFRASEGEGTGEIPGYDKVTELDDVTAGAYLIGAQASDGNWYVAYPSTVETTRYNQIAKVGTSTTISTTSVTFTGVGDGYSEVVIGSTLYRVTVKTMKTVAVELEEGESVTYTQEGNYASADTSELNTSVATITMVGTDATNDLGVATAPTATLRDGTYVIMNTRAQKLVNNTSATAQTATGLGLSGGTNSFNADTAVWTITAVDGGYTVQDANGKYLTIGSGAASLSDQAQVLTIAYANGTWTLMQNSAYLNDFGGEGSTAAGWVSSAALTDGGSQFAIYVYSEEGMDASTEITFTGVAEGTTAVTIDCVRYEITVGHTHNHEAVVTAPTCTAGGYTTYTCACGDSYVGDETEALGHTHENGFCAVCGLGIARNTATGVEYGTVAEALDAAEDGQTVVLLVDCAESYVLVAPGVTLDLAGFALTADYVVGFDSANVVDNPGGGKLITGQDNVVLDESNSMVPVYDGTGYIFSRVGFALKQVENTEGNGVRINALAYLENLEAVELLKDGAADNNLQIVILLSWGNDQGTHSQKFVFNDDVVAAVYSSNNGTATGYGKMFAMTIAGADTVENLQANVMLVSGTNVEYAKATPLDIQ